MSSKPFEIKISSTKNDSLDHVARFLQPFVEANQILPRTHGELRVLLDHGFVARIEHSIVGFAAVEIYSNKLAEVQCLTVSESHRGQGIGKRLVDHCVEIARQKGVVELMAITATEDLFRRCGFDYSLPQQKRAMFIQTSTREIEK